MVWVCEQPPSSGKWNDNGGVAVEASRTVIRACNTNQSCTADVTGEAGAPGNCYMRVQYVCYPGEFHLFEDKKVKIHLVRDIKSFV